jgi:type III pantothenate kinase
MLLAVDIGNTNIVMGVWEEEILKASWRIATRKEATSDEYGILISSLLTSAQLSNSAIKAVIIANVVPSLQRAFESLAYKFFQLTPLNVGPGIKTGMPILTENPKEVGADLIVGAVAAYELFVKASHKAQPLLVIDFGTATTFCAVSAQGEYLGAAIAPGLLISSEALSSRAAKLPHIELSKPASVIGKNTLHSMQAGVIFGFAGLTEGLIQRFKQELGSNTLVVATGGLTKLIKEFTPSIDHFEPDLILKGLRIIYERNK